MSSRKKPQVTPDALSFKTEAGILRKALGRLSGIVERRNTIPILAFVLIASDGDKLTLTATNLGQTMVETVSGHASGIWSTATCLAPLYAMVQKMPATDVVEFTHTEGDRGLSVRCGAFETILFTLLAVDFPTTPENDRTVKFNLPAASLRALIDHTVFAISTEETRYYLNGIYLCVADGHLRAVATDGHRMALMDQPLPDGAAELKGTIIPRKTIAELRKLLAKYTGDVEVAYGGEGKFRMEFRIPGISLVSKEIDGTYPNYTKVIPAGNELLLMVDNKTLSGALARVAGVSSERSRPVKMAMSEDAIVLSARSPEVGEATERMNGGSVTYSGAALDIGFQARYLKDLLAVIGPAVSVAFKDGGSPTVFRGADGAFTGILMPMRI